jgi:hypothetical protein
MAVLAFCVGAAYWPGLYSWAMPKWWTMAIGLALFVPFSIRDIDPVAAGLAACGLLMAGLSVFESPHFYGGCLDLFFCILLCGMAMGAAALDDVGPVIGWLGWAVSISVAASVFQVFGWYIAPHVGYAGLYLNSEVMGELAAVLFIWAFWSRRWHFVAIMGLSVVLCASRISFLVVALGLLYGWRAPRWVKWGLLAFAAAVGFFAIGYLGDYKMQTAMTRMILWGTAVLSLVPGGHGLAWWHAAHPFALEEFVHSDVLQWMVEVGVGAVFFLAIPVMVLRRGVGGVAERAAYIGICVEAVISFPLHMPTAGFLAAVLTGHLASRRIDVCVAGSQRGMGDDFVVRWTAKAARSLAGALPGNRRVVSVRSALAGFADAGAAPNLGSG